MNFLISLLHARSGAVVQWLVGMFVGWISAMLVHAGLDLPADSFADLSHALELIGAFVVTLLVQWYQAVQAKKLQAAVGAKDDGWIGSETLGMIGRLVDRVLTQAPKA